VIHYMASQDTTGCLTMPPTLDPRWLTPKQAAEMFGVSRVTIFRMLNDGRLTDVRTRRPNARVLYLWQPDLEKFLEVAYPPPPDEA